MAVNAAQFISITRFHQQNLNQLLEQYIDLPEAPGILAAMIYLQQSINKASPLLPEKEADGPDNSPDTAR